MHFLRKCGEMKRLRLNSRARKAFQGSSRGFTMVEVVIAIALIGAIAVTILSGLSTASLALIITDERATAESLARSQLEYAKNQDYKKADPGDEVTYLPIPGTSIPDGYTICSVNRVGQTVASVIGVAWNSTTNQPMDIDVGLQKIKLVIEHDDEELITLEGYKREPVT